MDLHGVDVEWVVEKLTHFRSVTKPINQSSSGSGFISMTNRTKPECGREVALALAEPVHQILNRLYPNWQLENDVNPYDEFAQERDASARLLARIESFEAVSEKLGGVDDAPRISAGSLHPQVWGAAKPLWSTDHRHEAVGAAAKAVNAYLQTKVGRRDLSEAKLIQETFSDKPPEQGKPRLRFDGYSSPETRDSMLSGVRGFGSGCFQAIRNPLSHLPNDDIEIDEQSALERLAALSLLARWIEEASLKSID